MPCWVKHKSQPSGLTLGKYTNVQPACLQWAKSFYQRRDIHPNIFVHMVHVLSAHYNYQQSITAPSSSSTSQFNSRINDFTLIPESVIGSWVYSMNNALHPARLPVFTLLISLCFSQGKHTHRVFKRNSCIAIITLCNAHWKTNETVLINTSTCQFFLYNYLRIAVHASGPNDITPLLVETSLWHEAIMMEKNKVEQLFIVIIKRQQ